MDLDTDVHFRWDHHQTTLLSVFSSLLHNENLVDCTISAEGQHFKAHRVILSACSPYFELLFSEHCEMHPVIVLPDVKFQILKALMEFMYSGEVQIPQDMLYTVLELAETLQIKGLTSAGDSQMKDTLRHKRRNESSILCDQLSFKKHLSEHNSGSQVKQREGVSSLHNLKKEHSEDIDHSQVAALMSVKSNSSSVSPKRTVEKAPVFQDISDTEAFNMLQCSSVTKTLITTNTHLSGTLLNSDSNILDSTQLPGYSRVKVGEQTMSDDNVISTNISSEELRSSSSLGVSGERRTADLPQMKQEEPDDFNNTEVIILNDDTNESDNHDYDCGGGGGVNSETLGQLVRMIPEETFSSQSFCRPEPFIDSYFVKSASILPNPYKCNVCGRSYQYSHGLSRHLRLECGKKPQFRCLHCPKRFFHKHHLGRHIVRTHGGLRTSRALSP